MSAPDLSTLARLIAAHAPYDGTFELRVPGVYAIKVAQPRDLVISLGY